MRKDSKEQTSQVQSGTVKAIKLLYIFHINFVMMTRAIRMITPP